MLQLPTGAGKTVIAANIIRRARAKGKRVAFTVSALSLIDQTVAAFEAEGSWVRSRQIAYAKGRAAHG
jgi:superfamily II DNA or RNA helicase